jgi:TonB family protein
MKAYVAGKLSAAEQYRVEKYLLDHPFEAEAMEGYLEQPTAFQDLPHLQSRLSVKLSERSDAKIIPFWRTALPYAAVFLLLIMATVLIVNIVKEQQEMEKISLHESDALVPEESASPTIPPPAPAKKKEDIQYRPAPERKEIIAKTVDKVYEVADLVDDEIISREELVDLVMVEENDDTADFFADEGVLTEEVQPIARAKKLVSTSELSSGIAPINKKMVSGKVVDDAGNPLPGVNVVLKGKETGVTTNIEGEFEIEAAAGETLVASFIGMESEEVAINDRKQITIEMEPDVAQLSEVVVTYGNRQEYGNTYYEAEPAIGYAAFNSYIKDNLMYPKEALENKTKGRVVLRLTISVNGKVARIEVTKSLGKDCDEEAIRLIKEGPEWTPAKRGNTPVESNIKIRIRFRP